MSSAPKPYTEFLSSKRRSVVPTGIGSEGHVALKMGRRFVGAELKRSYFEQARRNLAAATAQIDLFQHVSNSNGFARAGGQG